MTTLRTASVLFKRPGFLTLSFRKGEVMASLTEEEARRVIDAGEAVPVRPDIDDVNVTRVLAGLPDTGA